MMKFFTVTGKEKRCIPLRRPSVWVASSVAMRSEPRGEQTEEPSAILTMDGFNPNASKRSSSGDATAHRPHHPYRAVAEDAHQSVMRELKLLELEIHSRSGTSDASRS